ncbi:MAG: site-specific DNA-methyltransferase [Bacteroidales bacterium]|nr:site-specific DNA-methyltransferase [Bacteroidales bacterium]
MDGKSLSITEERIKELKKIFPEVFSENRVDFDRLRNILGDNVKDKDERYNLSWAGKSDAYRILQQPSFATLIPQKEESVDFDKTDNIFIEGENLEVLKILQRSYFNKIKMIYIDPPYNTGKDSFIYPDKFSETKKDYQQRIGVKDEEGKLLKEGEFNLNSKENGQYHSNWLNMMMPRLFLAKNLLKNDGVIFVSIDDNEVHNLKLLMNEIFGEENFIVQLNWKKKKQPSFLSSVASVVEYILVYGRNAENIKKLSIETLEDSNKPIINASNNETERTILKGIRCKKDVNFIAKGSYRNRTMSITYLDDVYIKDGIVQNDFRCMAKFRTGQDEINKFCSKGVLFITRNLGLRRDLLEEEKDGQKSITNLLLDWGHNQDGSNELKLIFDIDNEMGIFDNPKPVLLISNIIKSIMNDNCIILDFFAGSGTTGHALMKLNSEDEGTRKFILVQLPEICKDDSVAKKNGYNTIAEICKERLRRAGKKIKEDITAQNVDTGFKVFELQESNFKQWKEVDNEKDLSEQLEMFVDDIKDKNINEINILYEIIIKHGYNLNSTIEKRENLYFVSDKSDNKQMLACLNGEINKELISQITQSGVKNIVVLDRLFKGNDCLKTNMYLEMKDNDINFECI